MESYLRYLVTKYFIFRDDIDLDNKKAIRDISELMIKEVKKVDNVCINVTKKILDEFLCFDICVDINMDKRILKEKAEMIYLNYKKYKSSSIRETETYLNLDNSLDTSKTIYVESVDIKTDFLKGKFGDYIRTGKVGDNYRYEYKFSFINKGKRYIFSLYDYLNTNNEFDEESEIYWHVSSNTKKKDIVLKFIKNLNDMINGVELYEEDDGCC